MSLSTAARFRSVALPMSIGLSLVLLSACPAPQTSKPRRRANPAAPSYPYRGKTIRTENRIHIFAHTKTRALGVMFQPAAGGLVKPVAIVGVDARRGSVRWTKPVALKRLNPELPWSFEIARNVTILAAWVEGDKIKAFDIYGRDAWESKLTGVLGVAKLGEGFITAKGSKIYFLDIRAGRASEVADLGAPITAPLSVLAEGEVIALTGDFLVGVNLDAKGDKVLFRHRLGLTEGLLPIKPQVKADSIVVGSRAVPLVIKTEVSLLDPNTLKPTWKQLLPGRIRSHDSLHVLGDQVRVVNRIPGRQDHLYMLNAKSGQVVGKIKAKVRRGCQYGLKQLYCVTRKAVVAYDRKTLQETWRREMLDDVSGNQHLAHGGTFYIAEGSKVVGVDTEGRVGFSFEIKAPPYRPQVNRVLGIVGDTLVITVADWIRMRGTGQIWGVNLTTGKRRWVKQLPAPAYTERAVQLVGELVIWADALWTNACVAKNGMVKGRWMHLIRAPATKLPRVSTNGKSVWMTRAGQLVLLSSTNGRVIWKTKLGMSKLIAAGRTLAFLKTPTGEIRALDLKTGKLRWKVQYDATLTPHLVEAPGGVIISHHSQALVLDPATGAPKATWKPGGWQLRLMGDAPLLVRVLTFEPQVAGMLEAVRFDRERKKASQSWIHTVPRPAKPEKPLDSAVQNRFPWFHVAGDLVLYPSRGGRCLSALDIVDGKQRWKECTLAWVAPPPCVSGVALYDHRSRPGRGPRKPPGAVLRQRGQRGRQAAVQGPANR